MAVVSTITNNSIVCMLNMGTSSGVVQTKNVSIGRLANSGFDAEKALNIADALEDVLTREIYRVRHVQTATLSRG